MMFVVGGVVLLNMQPRHVEVFSDFSNKFGRMAPLEKEVISTVKVGFKMEYGWPLTASIDHRACSLGCRFHQLVA